MRKARQKLNSLVKKKTDKGKICLIKTILVNITIFYHKNNLCLYKMVHVATPKGASSGIHK